MKKKIKVLALFDAIRPTTIDQDLSKEMKTEDWKTEANVLAALNTLGHPTEHLAIFDNLDEVHGIHPTAKSLSLKTAARATAVPFHPAAAEFYKSRGVMN